MTEDEAKSKWCPFINARAVGEYGERSSPASQGCIGAACMAWRPVAMVFLNSDGAEIGRTEDKQNGFCGLAGGLK